MKNIYTKDNSCTIYKLKFHQLQQYLLTNGYLFAKSRDDADKTKAGVETGSCPLQDEGA